MCVVVRNGELTAVLARSDVDLVISCAVVGNPLHARGQLRDELLVLRAWPERSQIGENVGVDGGHAGERAGDLVELGDVTLHRLTFLLGFCCSRDKISRSGLVLYRQTHGVFTARKVP